MRTVLRDLEPVAERRSLGELEASAAKLAAMSKAVSAGTTTSPGASDEDN